jgi:type 1 glutamine amidotransferase
MRRTLPFLAVVVGCGYDPPPDTSTDAPPVGVPDARPEGQLDGLCDGDAGRPRVLVYSRENLWRHESNYDARLAIFDMCEERGYSVITTNDPLAINAGRLAQVDVVVFAITSGTIMDALGRQDLEAFVRGGGGLIGLHSASATEWVWPFFVGTIGAQFAGHNPGMQEARVDVVATEHPITAGMPAAFRWTEEWYFFQQRPEEVAGLEIVLALDEDKVGYHPIAWAHEKDGGRVFYTALGHNPEAFHDEALLDMLARAIEWAAHQR